MSPVDEWVYIDYLDRVPTDGIIRQGDYIEPPALDRMACDGVYPYGRMGPACGSHDYTPAKYPYNGQQTAQQYTPAYFWTTWAVGGLLTALLPIDVLSGWRLTSVLWLLAGLVALWRLSLAWRLPRLVAVALGMLFASSTYSFWTYTYVSTDAPGAFFGASLLLAATNLIRGQRWPLTMAVLAVVAVMFKATNVLAVALAAMVVGIHAVSAWVVRRGEHLHRAPLASLKPADRVRRVPALVAAVVAVVLAGVVQVTWIAIQRSIALRSAPEQGVHGILTPLELGALTTRFLPETLAANVVTTGGGGYALPIQPFLTAPGTWLLIAGVVGSLMGLSSRILREEPDRWATILAVALASVTFAPGLALLLMVSINAYFEMPPRYGGMLLPGMLLLAGFLLRSRWMTWSVIAYATGLGIFIALRAVAMGS